MDEITLLIIFALICLLPLFLGLSGLFFRIVPEYERLVLVPRRTGEEGKIGGPGFVFFNPFQVDLVRVDLREKIVDVEFEGVSRPEMRKFKLKAVFGYRIIDPLQWVKTLKHAPADTAMQGMAIVSLRSIIEGYTTEEIIARQPEIEEEWRRSLNEKTGSAWGVKITMIEIQKMTRSGMQVEDL